MDATPKVPAALLCIQAVGILLAPLASGPAKRWKMGKGVDGRGGNSQGGGSGGSGGRKAAKTTGVGGKNPVRGRCKDHWRNGGKNPLRRYRSSSSSSSSSSTSTEDRSAKQAAQRKAKQAEPRKATQAEQREWQVESVHVCRECGSPDFLGLASGEVAAVCAFCMDKRSKASVAEIPCSVASQGTIRGGNQVRRKWRADVLKVVEADGQCSHP
jgi:hypothetical protein